MAERSPNRLDPHPAQTGLLIARAAEGGPQPASAYAYRVRGALDEERLSEAYMHALHRYDALTLAWSDGESGSGRWSPGTSPRVEVSRQDLRTLTPAARRKTIHAWAARQFELRSGPVGTVQIARTGEEEWVVVETFDHVLVDGRSLDIAHRDVVDHYTTSRQPKLPDKSVQRGYADVLAEVTPTPASTLDYWRRQFEDYEPPMLPPQRTRADTAVTLVLDAGRIERVTAAVGAARGTLAAALLAAFSHAVARYQGRGDTVIQVAIDARSASDLEVFGHFIATVPLRMKHDWSAPVADHVRHITRQLLELRDHLSVDPVTLARLGAPTSLRHGAAAAFVMQPYAATYPQFPGLSVSRVALPGTVHVGAVTAVARQLEDQSVLTFTLARDGWLPPDCGAALRDSIDVFLRTLERTPHVRLGDDRLLAPTDRRRITAAATPAEAYPYIPTEETIRDTLRRLGSRVVLIDDGPVRADQLLDKIEDFASLLRDAGAGPGDHAVVADVPTADRIAAFVGSLAAGVTYVPVESVPAGRDPRAVLTLDATGPAVYPRPRDPLGAAQVAGPDAPAYVIHTSGTSGKPRGVVVSRGALSNLIQGEAARFGLDPASRVLLVAPPTTDPWICHVAGALTAAATLVRVDALGDALLSERLQAERVTHAFLPNALLRGLSLTAADLPHLRLIASAGDICRADDFTPFASVRTVNIYGPTEATVTATVAELTSPTDPVPVGRPIRGVGARIVIDGMASAPVSVPGELVLNGAGIAIGYLDDPASTAERFPTDPAGRRSYRTGDIAVLRPDGQLIVTGRIDRQVKIRGSRVEPEAVEAAARATGLCVDAFAKTYPNGPASDRVLVLFVEGCTDQDSLVRAVGSRLTAASRPHHVVPVGALPRLPSGKIDDPALPADYRTAARRPSVSRPATALGRIWAELLTDDETAGDHFFELGGDSLTVLRLVDRARAAGVELAVSDVYRHPRRADLERVIAARASTRRAARTGGLAEDDVQIGAEIDLGPAQRWILTMAPPTLRSWHQSHLVPFARLPDRPRLEKALTALCASTPILRSTLDTTGHRFIFGPVARIEIPVLDDRADDDAIVEVLRTAIAQLDPAAGDMVRAVAIRQRHGEGVLVLAAHHLVVDVWSWQVITNRLRRLLAMPPTGEADHNDHGFGAFAKIARRLGSEGAFDLDIPVWRQVLASGRTTGASTSSASLTRTTRRVRPPAGTRTGNPVASTILAALGIGLQAGEGPGTTVVDLERNGRSAIEGLDLSDAVGWVALHHPVAVPHGPAAAPRLDTVPDSGLGYGVLRWCTGADLGPDVGRLALDIAPAPSGSTMARIRRLTAEVASPVSLPYQASITVLVSPDEYELVMHHDPARFADAASVLEATATALQGPTVPARSPRRAAGVPGGFDTPIPVTNTQALMLHHAATRPGVYLPRQVLALTCRSSDREQLLLALGAFLGALDPMRRRFGPGLDDPNPVQFWTPGADPLSIRLLPGGRAAAENWLRGPDRLSAAAVLAGAAPAAVVAFDDDEKILLGMECHHALMDGPSVRRLGALLQDFCRAYTAGDATPDPTVFDHSRSVLRKHVSCEQHWRQPHPPRLEDAPRSTAATRSIRVDVGSRQVSAWARLAVTGGIDLRALLTGLVADAGRTALAVRTIHVVTNGRDPNIPGSVDATGLFWHFTPFSLSEESPRACAWEAAQAVYSTSGGTLADIRAAAATWRTWSHDSLAVNVLKESPDVERGGQMASRDLFHFRAQADVLLRADGSLSLLCTVVGISSEADLLAATLGRLAEDRPPRTLLTDP